MRRKFMSSVLALVMCLILCVPAFAATITTGKDKISSRSCAGENVEDESPMDQGTAAPRN